MHMGVLVREYSHARHWQQELSHQASRFQRVLSLRSSESPTERLRDGSQYVQKVCLLFHFPLILPFNDSHGAREPRRPANTLETAV